jgi:hypothetical protein
MPVPKWCHPFDRRSEFPSGFSRGWPNWDAIKVWGVCWLFWWSNCFISFLVRHFVWFYMTLCHPVRVVCSFLCHFVLHFVVWLYVVDKSPNIASEDRRSCRCVCFCMCEFRSTWFLGLWRAACSVGRSPQNPLEMFSRGRVWPQGRCQLVRWVVYWSGSLLCK